MGLDFTKLSRGSPADSATEPRRIFTALPRALPKYSYPRDVQSEVWDDWHSRRTERDLVIKMNTGGGKTTVGLVILKSCLNEKAGPAVYAAPDRYLADQVRNEARDLGIETESDPRSARFQSSKAVLVVTIHALVNGLSKFGTAGTERRIDIGTLLVDDAHACVAAVEDQYTLEISGNHTAYKKLVELFRVDLEQQSPPSAMGIHDGDPHAVLPVPFWAWADRAAQVLQILHPDRNDEGFKFVWPLIAEVLPVCRVAISGTSIEIAPPCPPVETIPSLAAARRRIYMTATLPDDGILVTHFGADPTSVARAITPRSADDLGDRMILTPLDSHRDADEVSVREFVARLAVRRNVVVIVPSRRHACLWAPLAAAVHDRNTIEAGVAALKAGHVGLVVLINKYDGIDLPGKACRVLVIDSLPEAYGALARVEARALDGSDATLTRQVQRIEQGMGRGVRSNDDYCAVLLLGPRLTERMHHAGGFSRFSPATKAQLELSSQMAEMLAGTNLASLEAVIEQCLDRDPGWVSASRSALDGVTYEHRPVSPVSVAERSAFEAAAVGQYKRAAEVLDAAASSIVDPKLRGWTKAQVAAYLHHVDPVNAQRLLTSALADNRGVTKPRHGVGYSRLSGQHDQAAAAAKVMGAFATAGELLLRFHAMLDDLQPDPDNTSRFERGWHELGHFLGFESQMPERELGNGPDVLWSIGGLRYFVTECKSGATTDMISRSDCVQLSGSIDWFLESYDKTCTPIPLLLHRTKHLHGKATAREGTQVITFEKLASLRASVRKFAEAIASGEGADPAFVGDSLAAFHLTAKQFLNKWAVPAHR